MSQEKINKSQDLTVKELTFEDIKNKVKNMSSKLNDVDVNKLQYMLEDVLHDNSVYENKRLYHKSQDIIDSQFYLNDELHELISLLPFKTWKEKKLLAIDDKEYIKKNSKEISLELIDTLFFYTNITNQILDIIGLDKSQDTLKALYIIKYMENIKRVEQGVFEMKKEFSKEQLEMLENIKNILTNKTI